MVLTSQGNLYYWTEDNAFDRYGNRWELVGGNPFLTLNATNNRITSSGYSYDASGNLTDDTLHTYAFDAENRIKTVDGVANAYIYDGEGKRVRKFLPLGDQVRFVYGVSGQLVAEYDATTGVLEKEYVYGASGLLATIEPTAVSSNGTRYTTSDHLGSPRVVTNSSAGVFSRHDYMPFGEELGSGVGGRTTAMGFSVVDGLRQKFTQKARDNETGLDYFLARYYSSTQGRFTGADSFAGSTLNPQTLNRYAYVANNPLRFTDPTGHFAMSGSHTGSLEGWLKWYKGLPPLKSSMPRLCGSGCGQDPKRPQDPNKPNLPVPVAPAGVPDIPEGTVGIPTVTEFQPIPPHKGFWQRIKGFFGFGSSAVAATSTWGKPETLQDHFERHGGEFGVRTSEEYAQEAQDLLLRASGGGAKMKIGPDGVIRVYEAETNTFASFNMNGTTRTMFKPPAEDIYFMRQPGRSPWFPRGAEPEVEPEVEPELEPEIPIEIPPLP